MAQAMQDIGYIKDNLECKGGENLSTEDKQEIDAFAEKTWGKH